MDLIEMMNLDIERNKQIVKKYTSDSILIVFDNLKKALQSIEKDKIIYCVNEICNWYQKALPQIQNNTYVSDPAAHIENYERFLSYKKELETYDFSKTLFKKQREVASESRTMIFISHSSKDENTVRQFETFVRGLGIKSELIFCSSIEGQGVKNGERIESKVREIIKESKLLIYILSKHFFESAYCLQELGAGWILRDYNSNTFLIKLDDIEHESIKGFVNADFKYSELTDDNLDELIDDIRMLFEIPHSSSAENKKLKKQLLTGLK